MLTFQCLDMRLSRSIVPLAAIAAQLFADRRLAKSQNIRNLLLGLSFFTHAIDDVTVFLAETTVSVFCHVGCR